MKRRQKRSGLIMERYGYEVRTFLLSVTRSAGEFGDRLLGERKEGSVRHAWTRTQNYNWLGFRWPFSSWGIVLRTMTRKSGELPGGNQVNLFKTYTIISSVSWIMNSVWICDLHLRRESSQLGGVGRGTDLLTEIWGIRWRLLKGGRFACQGCERVLRLHNQVYGSAMNIKSPRIT